MALPQLAQLRQRRRAISRPIGPPVFCATQGPLTFEQGLGVQDALASRMSTFFSHVSLPSGDSSYQDVLLIRNQPLGQKTLMELSVQATHIKLKELRLRFVHSLLRLQAGHASEPGRVGSIALTTGTDLRRRHRLTLESTMGCEEDKQSVSTSISSDFASGIAWGVAFSYKLGDVYASPAEFVLLDPKLNFFSRYSSDDYGGRMLILQAVRRVGTWDTVSAMCSAALGRPVMAGLSWKHHRPNTGDGAEESIQLKLICGTSGAYALSVKAQHRLH